MVLFVGVAVPTFFGVPTRIEPSEPVRDVYEYIQHLPPRSLIWVPYDLWALNKAEVQPAALAVIRHMLTLGHRLVVTSLIVDGTSLSEAVVEHAAHETGRHYGTDYVILGYKSGNQMAIKQICSNLEATFPVDIHGTPLDKLPVAQAFHNARSVDFVFAVCDNNLFDAYAAIANTEYGRPLAGTTTAVMVPGLSPYVNSRQILGVIGGLRGGAEYETLTGMPGEATAGMTAQSIVHLLIVGLIVVANISYWANRGEAA